MNRIDPKTYLIHNDKEIKGFFGDYRWLSNFHSCEVWYEGLSYPSSENAYQSAKIYREWRQQFSFCSPSESKRLWKQESYFSHRLYSSEEWNSVKYDIMSSIVFEKFYRNKDIRQKLIDTGGKYLEETNDWGDIWYGVDYKTGTGLNNLGKILMKVRQFWQ